MRPHRALGDFLVRHLSRRTTSGQFIAEVDGLRFYSIAMVVVFHIYRYAASKAQAAFVPPLDDSLLASVVEVGKWGPHVFFVISGFVLALPFARWRLAAGPAVDLRRYYLRRLKRIEPPYLIALTLLFVAFLLRGWAFGDLVPHYLAGLAYSHVLLLHSFNVFMPVSWSLEVEVQFYLLAPLLASLFVLRSAAARIGSFLVLAAAAITWRSLYPHRPWLIEYIEFFMVGFLVAELYVGRWREQRASESGATSGGVAWDVAALAALPLFYLVQSEPGLTNVVAAPLLIGVVFCAAFRGRATRALTTAPALTTIGGMCYSIYLLHLAVIWAIAKHSVGLVHSPSLAVHLAVQCAIIVPIILVVCGVYFYVIERPCMRPDWPQRLIALSRRLTR